MGNRHNIDEQIGGAHQDARSHEDRIQEPYRLQRLFDRELKKELLPSQTFDYETRKAAPLWSGVMRYFPDALLAVARLSKKANDKHNPGEPLGWSKEKSNDHGDCIARHQLNPEEIDPEFDEIHAVMVAWRALAQLQTIIEKENGT